MSGKYFRPVHLRISFKHKYPQKGVVSLKVMKSYKEPPSVIRVLANDSTYSWMMNRYWEEVMKWLNDHDVQWTQMGWQPRQSDKAYPGFP